MSIVLVNSRLSLFPHVPPYHVFLPYWREYTSPPCAALTQEEWQFPAQIMPVVRDVVQHAGFRVKKVHNNGLRRNCTLRVGCLRSVLRLKGKGQV